MVIVHIVVEGRAEMMIMTEIEERGRYIFSIVCGFALLIPSAEGGRHIFCSNALPLKISFELSVEPHGQSIHNFRFASAILKMLRGSHFAIG